MRESGEIKMVPHHLESRIKANGKKSALGYSLIALGFAGIALLLSSRRKRKENAPENPFVMHKIEQRKTEITLSWPDVGGTYRVFRNHELIYSGLEPYATDQQLASGTLYTYTIERIDEQGHVLDRTKIQTATKADEESEDNVLKNTIVTTIIRKGQISLEWEPVDGIKEYDVYRNGKFMKKTDQCYITDHNIKDDKEYFYTIKAGRPLQRSEQQTREIKTLISSIIGIAKKDSSQESAVMEEFSITKQIGPITQHLNPAKSNNHKQIRLRYTTFLTDKWLENPNPASLYYYFKGDNRSFNPDASQYRTRADLYIYDNKEDATAELSKEVGKTKAYSRERKLIEKARASAEGITLEKVLSTDDWTAFKLTHSVGNPLVVSPAIDYEVHITIYRNSTIDIVGSHDQSPHHEVYLNQKEDSG